jgi:hypothetical protein
MKAIARGASAGVTENVGDLTAREARSALRSAQVLGTSKGPDHYTRHITRRPPPESEIKATVEAPAKAAAEIKARKGAKHGVQKGKELQARTSTVRRVLSTDQYSHQAVVEDLGPKGGVVRRTLDDGMVEGRHKSGNIQNSAEKLLRKSIADSGITFERAMKVSDYVAGTEGIVAGVKKRLGLAPKKVKLKLSSGTLEATPAQLAGVAFVASDPQNRRDMLKFGQSHRGTNQRIKITEADLKAIEAAVPKDLRSLGVFAKASVLFHLGEEVKKEYWKAEGEQLKTSPGYVPRRRNWEFVREGRVKANTPYAQNVRYMEEQLNGMFAQARAEATLEAKAARAQVKTLPVGERAAARKQIRKVWKEKVSAIGKRAVRGSQWSSMQEGGAAEKKLSSASIVKKRTGSNAPFVIEDIFEILERHVAQSANYAGKAVASRDASSLIYSNDFQNAVRAAYKDGPAVLQNLEKSVEAYKGLEHIETGAYDRAVNTVYRNFHRGILSSPKNALYQIASLDTAKTEIPAKYINASVIEPGVTDAQIDKYFPEVHLRMRGSGHMLASPGVRAAPGADARIRLFGRKGLIDKTTMGPLHFMDTVAIKRIVGASIKWAKADGFKGDKMWTEARRRAMRTIDRTQPTSDPLTITPLQLQAKTSTAAKLATAFSSQSAKQYGIALRAYNDWKNGDISFKEMTKKTSRSILLSSAIVSAIGTGSYLGMDAVTGRLDNADAEERFESWLEGTVDRTYGGWLVGRDAVDAVRNLVKGGFGRKVLRSNAVTGSMERTAKTLQDVSQVISEMASGEKYKRSGPGFRKGDPKWEAHIGDAIADTLRAIGETGGLPTKWFYPTIKRAVRKKRLRKD